MNRRRPPRSRAALLSVAVVVVPATASAVCIAIGVRAFTPSAAPAEPAGVLLGLAAVALAGVLAWACTAAAAGVVEAWRDPSSRRPENPRGPGAAPASTASSRTRSHTGVVSAGVAALVVAALTAPTASAASGAGTGSPVTVVSQPVDAAATGPGPSSAPGPASSDRAGHVEQEAPSVPGPARGSWAALGQDGFRAPRGASVGSASLVTAQPPRPIDPDDSGVVVMAGDSLWSIAARHLGTGADDAEVAAAWPRWWEANRHTVGEDPDLLLPGQRLVVPAP